MIARSRARRVLVILLSGALALGAVTEALALRAGVPVAERPTTAATAERSTPGAVAGRPAPGLVAEGSAGASAGTSPTVLAVVARPLPRFRHIYLIVMENREYGSIVGSAQAPYINSLIRRYGLATNYTGVAHPSQPNYLALFSGSTQGVHDDGVHDIPYMNLADQLGRHGLSMRIFAQNVPLGCYKGATASGGPDGSGTYARKHEPAISFTDFSGNARRCAAIQDFSHFSPTAAAFELIVPNMCDSMHDCSTAKGDAWLKSFLPKVLRSPAMTGSVVFLTWDEGSSSLRGGGRVATVVIGPGVKRGYRSAVAHNHYSLLRTIERAWGLACLNQTCRANDLREFFR